MQLIVDGNNLAHRIAKNTKIPEFRTSAGKPTKVLHGFFNSLLKSKTMWPKSTMIVAWDGEPVERLKLYPDYKGQRDKTPNPIFDTQKAEIKEILTHLGIDQYYDPKEEADDIIAELTAGDGQNIIISEDKDFMQLINKRISLYRPLLKRTIDHDNFKEFFDCTPKQFLMGRILEGDTSDNIPGVKGIGKKAIEFLYTQHISIADLRTTVKTSITAIANDKRYGLIKDQMSTINLNELLMDLGRISLREDVTDYCTPGKADLGQVIKMFGINEFDSLIDKIHKLVEEKK